MIDDKFGDKEEELDEESILENYHKWLHKVANAYLSPTHDLHDDLVQEGRIAMWKALQTWDPTKGSMPSWLTGAAHLRMRDFSYRHGQPTGHEAVRGKREVEPDFSVDYMLDHGMEDLLGLSEALEGVEVAYHYGEIRKALEALPEAQQRYVFARFWAGLDPLSRSPEIRLLVAQVPELADRRLWFNARGTLKDSLAHLVGV